MNKNIQTLIESFGVDLTKLLNENFVEDKDFNEIENTRKFVLQLEKLEFGIFDKLILYQSKDGRITYEFNSSPISEHDIDKIERTTNSLYDILKNGTVAGTGKFKPSDKETILKYEFWQGKTWVDYHTSSMVLLDVKENIFRLNILTQK